MSIRLRQLWDTLFILVFNVLQRDFEKLLFSIRISFGCTSGLYMCNGTLVVLDFTWKFQYGNISGLYQRDQFIFYVHIINVRYIQVLGCTTVEIWLIEAILTICYINV